MNQMNLAMTEDLITVSKWLSGNRLSLNFAKPNAMVISTKHREKHLADIYEPLS